MKINKNIISAITSLVASAYTVFYMNLATPYKNSGALSKIGLEHKKLFIIWGILTITALIFATSISYSKHSKNKLYIPLTTISVIGMFLTLMFDFDYNIKPDYYLHCIGSLVFSVSMGINIFVLFLFNSKKHKLYKFFAIITAGILLSDLVFLIIYKETGLIEVIPIFAGYIMLGITNFRRDKIEINK